MKFIDELPQIDPEYLDQPIEALQLSTRSYNCMRRAGIDTIRKLTELSEERLSQFKNIGRKSVVEIIEKMNEYFYRYSELMSDKEDDNKSDQEENTADIINAQQPENEHGILDKDCKTSQNEPDNRPFQIVFGFSVRTYNALTYEGITTVQDLLELSEHKLHTIRNLGAKSLNEIREGVKKYKAEHGMDLSASESEYDDQAENDERSIDIFNFSTRTYNALRRAGIDTVGKLIRLTYTEIIRIKNLGGKSVKEIMNVKKEYICPEKKPVKTDFSLDDIKSLVMECFNEPFKGISFKEFREALPEEINDNELKKAVGFLLAEKIIEYVDFRCYKTYPYFADYFEKYINTLDDRPREVMQRRFVGDTLESIGHDLGITRERIRQIELKMMHRMRKAIFANKVVFYEDFYVALYTKANIPESFWQDELGLSETALHYLHDTYKSGILNPEEVLGDDSIPVSLRYRLRAFLDREKIRIDGRLIYPRRSELESYAVKKYAHDEITFNEFCEFYNEMLRENDIPFDGKLYLTEETKRTRSSRLSDSMLCLWKQGERLRYYDIESRDYTALIEALHLESYNNTEVSTQKFIDSCPELMLGYDIRDRYELHNLLKKIAKSYHLDNVTFARQPVLRFGVFNRVRAIFELIKTFSPVTQAELVDYLVDEYGYDEGTALGYLSQYGRYLHNGIYQIESSLMSEKNMKLLDKLLTEDFYYINEIKDIYVSQINKADASDVDPYILKKMGFVVNKEYAVRNFPNAASYFRYILTKDGLYDIEPYKNRFGSITMFNQIYSELLKNYQIFKYEKNQIITMKRLEKLHVTVDDIKAYCDDVYDYLDNDVYFTIHSLHQDGFSHPLENLGLDDFFYASILCNDDRFLSQYVFGTLVLYSCNTKSSFTISDFLVAQLREYDKITPEELIEDLEDRFAIIVHDRTKIIYSISDTGLYYDTIMDKIYRNKEIYYSDFDE